MNMVPLESSVSIFRFWSILDIHEGSGDDCNIELKLNRTRQ